MQLVRNKSEVASVRTILMFKLFGYSFEPPKCGVHINVYGFRKDNNVCEETRNNHVAVMSVVFIFIIIFYCSKDYVPVD